MKSISIIKGASDGLALDLETVKADLRISGAELDGIIIGQYIPAAIAWAENATKRSLISRTLKWIVAWFPGQRDDFTFCLPGGVVSAVGSITYIENGAPVILTGPSSSPAGTGFQESLEGPIARLRASQGSSWPTADSDAIEPITIEYTAGWASDKLVPSDLKRAMTAYVYGSLELDGLLQIRNGFDMDHAEKLISAYRSST